MTALLLFARRYWRVLAIAAAAGLVLYLISNAINGAIDDADARGYGRARGEMATQVAVENAATAAREAEQRELSRAHDIHYQETTRELQSRLDRITAARGVDLGRLRECAAARRDAPAGTTAAAAEPDGRSGQSGHDLPAGGDLGNELVQYAGACEGYRQQLSALQAWVSNRGPDLVSDSPGNEPH